MDFIGLLVKFYLVLAFCKIKMALQNAFCVKLHMCAVLCLAVFSIDSYYSPAAVMLRIIT